jgi:peptidoglycan hydrolase-like protein with peptidoglycan-binding domain
VLSGGRTDLYPDGPPELSFTHARTSFPPLRRANPEVAMEGMKVLGHTSVIALAIALASCSTWNSMSKSEKTGTAVGATGGAVAGAAVGGPAGAVVGAGVGGAAGHEVGESPSSKTAAAGTAVGAAHVSSDVVRSAQQALNDRGYRTGAIDGVFGPDTQSAVVNFQRAQNIQQTGTLDPRTLAALGVSEQSTNGAGRQTDTASSPTSSSGNHNGQSASNTNGSTSRNGNERMQSANSANQRMPSENSGNRREQSAKNNEPTNASGAANSMTRSDLIRSAQQALNDQGFDAGAVDGIYGPHTRSAVRDFQQAKGITQNGNLDRETLAKLGVLDEESNASSNGQPSQPSSRNVAGNDMQSQPGGNQAGTQSNGANANSMQSSGMKSSSMQSSSMDSSYPPPSNGNSDKSKSGM